MKIVSIERMMYCPSCGTLRNFKKEKNGKGEAPTWYCPKCGFSK